MSRLLFALRNIFIIWRFLGYKPSSFLDNTRCPHKSIYMFILGSDEISGKLAAQFDSFLPRSQTPPGRAFNGRAQLPLKDHCGSPLSAPWERFKIIIGMNRRRRIYLTEQSWILYRRSSSLISGGFLKSREDPRALETWGETSNVWAANFRDIPP